MTKEKYPLHPGQTEIGPYYVQIPQSEYESIKRENAQLHALLQETPRQLSNAEIDTLTSEVKALRDMNVKLQEEIAVLKDSQRWRSFKDEQPSEEGHYIVCGSSGFRNADKWHCKDSQKMDFSFYSYGVEYWMPMPKAPKRVK